MEAGVESGRATRLGMELEVESEEEEEEEDEDLRESIS